MDVLIYLRKSRAEELHDTTEETLRRHKEQLVALASSKGYSIIATYEEVVSGESLYARPQMLALLEAIGTGNYDGVLCMDIDRLGRGSMAEQGLIFDAFRRSGTKIITPDKIYDLESDADEEITELQGFIARRELKMIKKRLHRGIIKTVTDGGYIANAPYGYDKCKIEKRPSLTVNEEEAKFVRMIFDLYVNGGLGTPSIAAQINALGAHPRRSDHFERGTVTNILKNPVYIGKVSWDKYHYIKNPDGSRRTVSTPENRKIVSGVHPPIIDEDLFNRAQEIMNKKWHKKYYNGTVKNPLAGLVYCGNCGRLMIRHPAGKKLREPMLMCRTAGCIPASHADAVEAAVLEDLRRQLSDLSVRIADRSAPDVSLYDANINSAETELKKIVEQTSKIHDLLEQGVYDVDTFLDRRAALEERTAFLKKFLNEERSRRQSALDSDLSSVAEKLRRVLDVYDASDAAQRNALLRQIVESVTYYKDPSFRAKTKAPFSVSVKLRFL